MYSVAERSILACVHGDGCVFFIAVNCASDRFLSIKLTIQVQDGMIHVLGSPDDSHDVPPLSQKILVVVSTDGKLSSATHLTFRYMSTTVQTKTPHLEGPSRTGCPQLGRNLELNLFAEMLTSGVSPSDVQDRSHAAH